MAGIRTKDTTMSLFRALRALYREARAAGVPDEITHGYLRFGQEGMTPAAQAACLPR